MVVTREEAIKRGDVLYFIGGQCKNGHVSRRYTINGGCVVCNSEQCRKYYIKNKESRNEYSKQRYYKNIERYQISNKIWKAANKDRVRELNVNWQNENREKVRQSVRKWTNANRSKQRALNKAWGAANQEKRLEISRRRRARKVNAEGDHSAFDISSIRKMQKDKCAYCRAALKGKGHVDHIIALSKGGSNWPKNLQLLCQPCNQKKHAADPIEYANRLGRLL